MSFDLFTFIKSVIRKMESEHNVNLSVPGYFNSYYL